MKKILMILIALTLIFAACGASPGNTESEPAIDVDIESAADPETIEWKTVSYFDLQFDVMEDWNYSISDYYDWYKFGDMPDPCCVKVFEKTISDSLADSKKYTESFGVSDNGEFFTLNGLSAYEDKRIKETTYERFLYLLLVEKNDRLYTFDIFIKESGEDNSYPHPDIIYDHIKNSIR